MNTFGPTSANTSATARSHSRSAGRKIAEPPTAAARISRSARGGNPRKPSRARTRSGSAKGRGRGAGRAGRRPRTPRPAPGCRRARSSGRATSRSPRTPATLRSARAARPAGEGPSAVGSHGARRARGSAGAGTRRVDAAPSRTARARPSGPGQGEERTRGHEPARRPVAPERQPPLEEPEGEKHGEGHVGAVEKSPDDRPPQRHEARRRGTPSRGPPRRRPIRPAMTMEAGRGSRAEDDGEGDEPLPARPQRVGEGEDRRVEHAGGARGGRLARVVLEGVALGHRLRVLADHVEVDDLGDEVGIRRLRA